MDGHLEGSANYNMVVEQRDYWHEIALKLGPMLHLAERRVETLEEERNSLMEDVAALRSEIADMRTQFAERCICPACERCQ